MESTEISSLMRNGFSFRVLISWERLMMTAVCIDEGRCHVRKFVASIRSRSSEASGPVELPACAVRILMDACRALTGLDPPAKSN